MKLNLRRCTNLDIGVLQEISKATFSAAFEEHNEAMDFKNYLNFAFNQEKLLSELENENSAFYFAYDEDILVGYLKINREKAQTEIKEAQSFELERIYVIQSYQGMKIGEWMIGKVIKLAQKADKRYVWLGVWERNTRAIKFYHKLGFKQFGTHPYYIGGDKQTDWLMRLGI
ncbi:MAG: GNAT family N-acetyltransferase [Flavobacteriaceae bacterium]